MEGLTANINYPELFIAQAIASCDEMPAGKGANASHEKFNNVLNLSRIVEMNEEYGIMK